MRPAVLSILAFVISMACASTQDRRAMPAAPPRLAPTNKARVEAACFVGVAGAHVSVTELPDGIALTYSGEIDDVEPLRFSVRELAAQQNAARAIEGNPGDVELRPSDAMTPPVTALLAPGARATVTDTSLGARLTLVPVTSGARALIRRAVEARESAAANELCPPAVRQSPLPREGSGR
jgi:hypothetical protein